MDCWLCAGRGSGGAGEGEFDDDEDTAKGMARLFCEVGEAYMSLIVTAVQEVRPRGMIKGVGTEQHVGRPAPADRQIKQIQEAGCQGSRGPRRLPVRGVGLCAYTWEGPEALAALRRGIAMRLSPTGLRMRAWRVDEAGLNLDA